jgi:hypothetical protein
MNWYGISFLKMIGLAWDVKLPRFQSDEKQAKLAAVPAALPEAAMEPVSGD